MNNLNYKYKFTVFTATYNRGELLSNLYNDLINQTFIDFEWLIIDDGSDDDTRDKVDKWKREKLLNINYIYKINGGKHSAINAGVKNAKGELFFLADSDDRLVGNALELMLNAWNDIKVKSEFCGTAGLSCYANGKIVGTKFKEEFKEVPFVDIYYKYGVKGDKAVFFTTEIMKKYPFPEKENIKFVMEAVVWYEMSKRYKIKCINEVIQIKTYLEDGLTKNSYSKRNIDGLAFSYLCLINQKTYSILKFPRMWMNSYIYLWTNSLLGNKFYFKDIKRISDRLIYIGFFPLGYFLFLRISAYLKRTGIEMSS